MTKFYLEFDAEICSNCGGYKNIFGILPKNERLCECEDEQGDGIHPSEGWDSQFNNGIN